MKRALTAILSLVLPLVACSEDSGAGGSGGGGGGAGALGGGAPGTALSVAVPEEGRVFVKLGLDLDLDPPAVVTPADGATSTDWDLAFEGLDVFTNSGASGPGDGGGFGPLDPPVFLDDVAPEVPFIQQDAAGGAFIDWYVYDGTAHAIWSRYHVYGVRDGDRLWKVQILSYYGEAQGAPVSALYQVRYAEVSPSGAGATVELPNVDATAGGLGAPETAPSACLDLGTGVITPLAPAEARASAAWHLCFRRDRVSVNGGLGGPRGVGAVDLDAEAAASETLDEVKTRTAASEKARFEAVTHEALSNPKLAYHGDRIVSVFSDAWIEPGAAPMAPALASWLVVSADGVTRDLIAFEGFEGPTSKSPGTVKLRVKKVK